MATYNYQDNETYIPRYNKAVIQATHTQKKKKKKKNQPPPQKKNTISS